MSRYYTPSYLSHIRKAVLNHFEAVTHTQLWLTGPKGRGKSSLINAILSEFKARDKTRHLSSYFDFESTLNYNCPTLITRFADALITSVKLPKDPGDAVLLRLFDDVLSRIPSSNDHINTFLKSIADSKLESLKRNKIFSKNKENITFSKLLELYEDAIKTDPSVFGFSKPQNVSTCWKCLYILNAVGTVAEIEELGNLNLNTNVTGKWVTRYLLESIKSLHDLQEGKWILCLDGIECLLSTFLTDKGYIFLSYLIKNVQECGIKAIFISNESSVDLSLANNYYFQNLKNDTYRRIPQKFTNMFDSKRFVYFGVPEMSIDDAMSLLSQEFPNEVISRAIWKISGGNCHLLNKLIENYRDFRSNIPLSTVQKILAGSEKEVDDEFFPIKKPKEVQENYLHDEHCRIFVKNLYNTCLSEDIIKFENSMNNFLSSRTMEELRVQLNNKVHFFVTVFETIRYLLKKKKLQIGKSCLIQNKIILALMSSNILHYQINSNVIEFPNVLVERLLESYVDSEFDSLTKMEKIEYKANFLLNQRTMYNEVERITN